MGLRDAIRTNDRGHRPRQESAIDRISSQADEAVLMARALARVAMMPRRVAMRTIGSSRFRTMWTRSHSSYGQVGVSDRSVGAQMPVLAHVQRVNAPRPQQRRSAIFRLEEVVVAWKQRSHQARSLHRRSSTSCDFAPAEDVGAPRVRPSSPHWRRRFGTPGDGSTPDRPGGTADRSSPGGLVTPTAPPVASLMRRRNWGGLVGERRRSGR